MTRLAVLLLAACSAYAQVNTAIIVGQVTDDSGGVIVGASVQAKHVETNAERSFATDQTGTYNLSPLALGSYVLRVSAPGFKTAVREGIVLASGDRIRLDFQLATGALTESIVVTAETPLVNSVSPELGVLIDTQKVSDLPLNGRTFTDLVRLQPGVQANSVGGRQSFVLNGASQWGLNIALDGTDSSFIETPSFGYQDQRALITTVSLDSIQEFRVQTGAFTTETGRASGGSVNVITKSGTNSFHGSLFEYLRNDALDARNFFARGAVQKDKRRQNQFGGSLGGPIIRNRLFFFTNYEGVRMSIGQIVTGTVPTQSLRQRAPANFKPFFDEFVPLPTEPIVSNGVVNQNAGTHRRNDQFTDREDLINNRGDFNIGKTNTFLRYSLNKTNNSAPNLLPLARREWDATNTLATASNTWTLSPTVVNEFRAGFNRWFLPRRSLTAANGYGEVAIPGVFPTNYNNEGELRWADWSITGADNLSLQKGRHAMKAGFEMRYVVAGRVQKQNPVYTYSSVNDFLENRVERVRIIFGIPGADIRHSENGIYFQDDFRATKNLTLNLGLRWEYYSPWHGTGAAYNVEGSYFGPFAPRLSQIYRKDLNNFNPRFGFAWDVSGRQKTVIRGGYGVYSSPISAWGILGLANIDPRVPPNADYLATDIPGLGFPLSGNIGAAYRDPVNAVKLNLLPTVVPRRLVDPNLRDTYSLLGNLTVQQQITKDVVVQASYVTNNTRKAYMTRLLNQYVPELGRRPDPTISDIEVTENMQSRNYNAFQMSVRGRRARGFTFDAHYTWAHTIVYGHDDCCSGGGYTIQDMDNIAGSRGNSNVDIRHQGTVNFSYELPFKFEHGLARQILQGWAIQGITQMRTGSPVNIFSGRDTRGNRYSTTQRPDYVGGSIYVADRGPDNGWFRREAFRDAAPGRFGNLGWNVGRGPGLVNFDLSLHKSFPVWNESYLQFRADAFNAFNHANFNNPVNTLSNGAFGQILSARDPRILQLALRYQF
jgi:hypothetical protein